MDFLPDITPDLAPVEKICIIGAGFAGVCALKVIKDAPQFKAGQWQPTVYEARHEVGGVWLPAPAGDRIDPPLTPLYDSVTANLPSPTMAFSDFPYPPSTPLFPKASIVQKYIEDYADHFDLRQHISFNTTVLDTRFVSQKWQVQLSTKETIEYDYLIVANGHYRQPRLPNVPGIQEWLANGRAMHSVWYRYPITGHETVMIVGHRSSALDISAEIITVCKTLIRSIKNAPSQRVDGYEQRPEVKEYRSDGKVVFVDGTIESVDLCILGTGYELSFPFLETSVMKKALPPSIPPIPRELYNSTYHVFPLVKHIFPIHPAIPSSRWAIIGLPWKVAPGPIFEAQAKATAKAFSDPASLDLSRESVDIVTRYEEIRKELGGVDDAVRIARDWSAFEGEAQFNYRDELWAFAEADPNRRVIVSQREKDAYENKLVLRKIEQRLEKTGQAEGLLRGVGAGGQEEWFDYAEMLLRDYNVDLPVGLEGSTTEEGLSVTSQDRARL